MADSNFYGYNRREFVWYDNGKSSTAMDGNYITSFVECMVAQITWTTLFCYTPTAISRFIAKVYTLRSRVSQEALKRLELHEAKASRFSSEGAESQQ